VQGVLTYAFLRTVEHLGLPHLHVKVLRRHRRRDVVVLRVEDPRGRAIDVSRVRKAALARRLADLVLKEMLASCPGRAASQFCQWASPSSLGGSTE
jgi:hypothetical protein